MVKKFCLDKHFFSINSIVPPVVFKSPGHTVSYGKAKHNCNYIIPIVNVFALPVRYAGIYSEHKCTAPLKLNRKQFMLLSVQISPLKTMHPDSKIPAGCITFFIKHCAVFVQVPVNIQL